MAATNSIRAEPIEENGECRYKITDIIGQYLFNVCCFIT